MLRRFMDSDAHLRSRKRLGKHTRLYGNIVLILTRFREWMSVDYLCPVYTLVCLECT